MFQCKGQSHQKHILKLMCALCACVLSCFSGAQLFLILWIIVHQAPLSMEFSRQESWNGLPLPPPGDLPDSGIETTHPALQADSLPSESQGKQFSFLLSWPKGLFGFLHKMLQKNPNKLLSQPNIIKTLVTDFRAQSQSRIALS